MLRMVPFGDSHTVDITLVSQRSKCLLGVGREERRQALIARTLLQMELFHTGFIRGNGGALDADAVLFDRIGGVDGDLVFGFVTEFQSLVNIHDSGTVRLVQVWPRRLTDPAEL